MASDRSPHPFPRRQSIPLQDLSPPSGSNASENGRSGRHRGPGWRGSGILGGHRSNRNGGSYSELNEGSPNSRQRDHDPPHITTPRTTHQRHGDDDGDDDAAFNAEAFQSATAGFGGFGLSFDPNAPGAFDPTPPGPSRAAPPRRRSTLNIINERNDNPFASMNTPPIIQEPENDQYFSSSESDRTPLNHAAPIDGSLHPPAPFPDHNRLGSRLGDDLPNMEAGRRPLSSISSRSLVSGAGGSGLSRAGTMLRKASQRVVNLSNEPDAIDSALGREHQRPNERGRMEAPPEFPAMQGYAVDDRPDDLMNAEKHGPNVHTMEENRGYWVHPNPLKGNSLGWFGPENKIRLWLCEVLVHPFTEPVILLLIITQTLVLAIDAAKAINYGPRPKPWTGDKANLILLALFLIYTLEIIARVIVSGFIKNADEYSTIDANLGPIAALRERINHFFTDSNQLTAKKAPKPSIPQTSILRSFTSVQVQVDQPGHTRQAQRIRLARRAFLRHGFNRLDFVAVISFWLSFILSLTSVEYNRHVYVFRMLSCLRILRLLGLTSGTSVILRSLKKAAPLLVNVAFLIGFFWLLFAIVGVQAFKSSLDRTCVWYSDTSAVFRGPAYSNNPGIEQYIHNNISTDDLQFCGGYLDFEAPHDPQPWLKIDAAGKPYNGTAHHKGFLCPIGSLCVEGQNPYNGTVNFNSILQSLELVFVIMSANTFSDLMYYTMDSDFMAAALYFAFGIVILSLWLTNLLVAVITHSFQVIREESKKSAFAGDDERFHFLPDDDEVVKSSRLKLLWDKTYWLWILIISFDLAVMCLRSSGMGSSRQSFITNTESLVTLILDIEIGLRWVTDWRRSYKSRQNWVDLALAIITSVIQIPPIHNSGQAYSWLTFFQIVRIYRVVLAVSLTRDLITKVLGNVTNLLNLIIFVFLITFLMAIFAVQIFRGEFPNYFNDMAVRFDFADIFSSFIGMYQVLSSENWTALMYNATRYEKTWNTSWIAAMFFVMWFILANFIVLNMFIAVIQENFDVSEDEKRLQQVKAFLQQKELGGSNQGNLSLSTIFKLGRDRGRHRDPLDYGPATMEMLLQEAVFRDFLDEHMEPMEELHQDEDAALERPMSSVQPGLLSSIWTRVLRLSGNHEPNPFYSRIKFSRMNEEQDIRTHARQILSLAEQRKKAQQQYLRRYPRYNVSLFVFSPSNPVRRFCQRIVGPGRGTSRIEGVGPLKPVWYTFSFFIYGAIVAMVLIACVTTPLYQREYFQTRGWEYTGNNWFVWTDFGFAIVFSVEAIIKVVADGFFWTPNAYFRGSWGFIDGVVLVTLWINVATALVNDTGVSRAVGAFKALRALRLLNVSDSARETFHSVVVVGGWKVISAAFVSLSLLFPFAIYGLNLFNGQMRQCNNNAFTGDLRACFGEYVNAQLYSDQWNVYSPQVAANPYYSFDNFGHSLSILFQIVSQEGWTDVMWAAMSMTGVGQNPNQYNSQGNAVFFVIFNLLGAVFVLTLFVSVFMRNYAEQTGVAFLTAEQRSWLEARKLLRQISPSKRRSDKSQQGWRAWCYRVAVKKHGRWQRFLTFVLVCHLILLIVEWYPEPVTLSKFRDFMFLAFMVFYIANIIVRILGLTWQRFSRSSWDLFSLLAVTGTVITTLLDLADNKRQLYVQLHKLFLVSIALLLIPRNNQLDQLFKTAAASLPSIASLLATWFVLFLVFAIALTQTFGLTRFGTMEHGNLNFRNVPKALILLFRMSCGEGWNQIMEDYATINPPYCVNDPIFFKSDCGSSAWARSLFIAWNILSMYIFVSMFVSLIFESFSYVYQRSSGLSKISRTEIRRFKQAWATFDPEGTGFISKEVFPRLLGELSGVFEMRVYAGGEHSVGRILENCRVDTRPYEEPRPGVVHGVDLAELNRQLRMIDRDDIRRRRTRLEIFFQEIMVSAHPDRGVNFTSCLMILAHYNVISDSKSLRLEEYLRRRARLQRVEEEVNRNTVRGFFDMMYWTRQFKERLSLRHSARMVNVPDFAVPEIFVDDQDAGPSPQNEAFPRMSVSVGPKDKAASHMSRPSDASSHSPFGTRSSPSGSFSRERGASLSPNLRPHQGNSLSPRDIPSHSATPSADYDWALDGTYSPMEGSPIGGRSRANSALDRQNVVEMFDNSAWGESIRRSFTLRRNGTRARATGTRREARRSQRPPEPDPPPPGMF